MQSTILKLTAAVCGLAVMASSANAQLAYEWSPQRTKTHLTGKLVFLPNSGNGAPFQCAVSLEFFTGNIKDGADKLPVLTSAKVKGRGCESVRITGIPWYAGAVAPETASFNYQAWTSGNEQCVQPNGQDFFVQTNGQWNLGLNGSCFSGYLTANPPVTIVPVP
jgi:hypothetical protein